VKLQVLVGTPPCSSLSSSSAAPSAYPFCDDSLPIAARARALVSNLTLDEKIAQLSSTAGGVPRLGIPPYQGCGQETSGEDPAVAAAYSVEYVKGFQGEYGDDGRIRLSACCKHDTAYDMEKWEGFNRYTFNAKVNFHTRSFL
jgi:hypothetical protein